MPRLYDIVDFFMERPPLTGALVAGALYLLRKTRRSHMTAEERQHALDLYKSQRTYAERMYDPPSEDEESARLKPRK
jgi:hypothetical protein